MVISTGGVDDASPSPPPPPPPPATSEGVAKAASSHLGRAQSRRNEERGDDNNMGEFRCVFAQRSSVACGHVNGNGGNGGSGSNGGHSAPRLQTLDELDAATLGATEVSNKKDVKIW